MKSDDRSEIIDRALKALAAPELREAKASRALEELLVDARKSGAVPLGRLQQCVKDLVVQTGVDRFLGGDRAKYSHSDSNGFSSLFALFLLLILLLLLATRVDPDSDAASLLDELIQQILELMKGEGREPPP